MSFIPNMNTNMSDTKPDISRLGVTSSPSDFLSRDNMHALRYSSQGYVPASMSYGNCQQNEGMAGGGGGGGGFYDMGSMHGGLTSMMNTSSSVEEVSPQSHNSQSSSLSPPSMVGDSPAGCIVNSPGFNSSVQSPMGSVFHVGQSMSPAGNNFALSTKHMCAICGDRASGKHYGVYSCEGCKGFFKRTVRKDLLYACRDEKNCIVDKRQRNRCQYCRYIKCLNSGMKREAVQEERQRARERGEAGDVESTTTANSEMPVELILEAELATDPQLTIFKDADENPIPNICDAADKQLFSLVDWAKRVPHFTDLLVEDQVILLRAGWNELLIAGFSHRSTLINDGIQLATGVRVHRNSAHAAGVGTIFDRVLTELVAKMREMAMDKTELGCLRAVVLFNPDAKGLKSVQSVETLREKVYASLDEYCKIQYPHDPGRFAKLLLRLPALRSIGLKCIEHLFFFKLIGDTPVDSFLLEMLENTNTSG